MLSGCCEQDRERERGVLGKIREKSNQPNNQIRTLYPESNRMAAGVVLEKELGELG